MSDKTTRTVSDSDMHTAIAELVGSNAVAENQVFPLICALHGQNQYDIPWASEFPKNAKWVDGIDGPTADRLERVKQAYGKVEKALYELEAARKNLAGHNFSVEVPLMED